MLSKVLKLKWAIAEIANGALGSSAIPFVYVSVKF